MDSPHFPYTRRNSTAHIHDAVALCEFLRWLELRLQQPGAQHELTEVAVADKLEAFRREQPDFVSLSFDTISSIGGNGAIVHYKPGMNGKRRDGPGERGLFIGRVGGGG